MKIKFVEWFMAILVANGVLLVAHGVAHDNYWAGTFGMISLIFSIRWIIDYGKRGRS